MDLNTFLTKLLPEAPGKEIEVTITPREPSTRSTGMMRMAVVYVLEGEVEMQVRGGTLQRLGLGQVFTNPLKAFIP